MPSYYHFQVHELENGNNWALVNSGETSETDRSYIDHRAIAICRIISRG